MDGGLCSASHDAQRLTAALARKASKAKRPVCERQRGTGAAQGASPALQINWRRRCLGPRQGLAGGALAQLKDLRLFSNQIGDAGLIALAKAITPDENGKG